MSDATNATGILLYLWVSNKTGGVGDGIGQRISYDNTLYSRSERELEKHVF